MDSLWPNIDSSSWGEGETRGTRGEGREGSTKEGSTGPPPGACEGCKEGVVAAGMVAVGAEEGGTEMLGMATEIE
eukprot:6720673-Prorocentrum_lima.AAC.1